MSGVPENLDEWIVRLPARLDVLRDYEMDDEDGLDFSPGTLPDVETYLLGRFDSLDEVAGEEEVEILEGAAAYVGEVLLRLTGGGWAAAGPDVPPIEPDPALGLPAVFPLQMVREAIRDRSGDRFAGRYAEWDRTVRDHRAAHPSWTPVKRPTPGVDPVVSEQSDADYLASWLAGQENAFPQWSREYGAGAGWDFSAESLDRLGALVLRSTPTVDGFTDVADWYFGEALRRAGGGRWRFQQGDPEFHLYAGHPYVEKADGTTAVPRRALEALVEQADPHHLRKRYEGFVD